MIAFIMFFMIIFALCLLIGFVLSVLFWIFVLNHDSSDKINIEIDFDEGEFLS